MRCLTHYGLGAAVAAGARFLLEYVLIVRYCGSLACFPIDFKEVTGWEILRGHYLMEMSGAVGGLLGLVVAARLAPRRSRRLSLAQGFIVTVAPFLYHGPLSCWLVIDTVIWASAGAIAALLALGVCIAGSAVVRWVTAIYRWTLGHSPTI
jgi:hypothetical protein